MMDMTDYKALEDRYATPKDEDEKRLWEEMQRRFPTAEALQARIDSNREQAAQLQGEFEALSAE